jgi:hypothetical protein
MTICNTTPDTDFRIGMTVVNLAEELLHVG